MNELILVKNKPRPSDFLQTNIYKLKNDTKGSVIIEDDKEIKVLGSLDDTEHIEYLSDFMQYW